MRLIDGSQISDQAILPVPFSQITTRYLRQHKVRVATAGTVHKPSLTFRHKRVFLRDSGFTGEQKL